MTRISILDPQNIYLDSDKQKKELEDSILYASYIQKAMLPDKKEISRVFPDNFIFYQPRDVVSGDFYWFYRIRQKVVIAAADCTGHGVPGAFMSVLGISVLNQIILAHKEINAAGVLNQLREHVMKSLHQTGSMGEQKDGMDISLCIIDLEENTLDYAGALNPLYLVRNNNLIEYKPDRMPIGISPEERSFTNNSISLEKDDMLYLFSDGFPDQFGGNEGNKFKYKAFRELLTQVSSMPAGEQRQVIEQTFTDWRGNMAQIDDVLVLGVRYTY